MRDRIDPIDFSSINPREINEKDDSIKNPGKIKPIDFLAKIKNDENLTNRVVDKKNKNGKIDNLIKILERQDKETAKKAKGLQEEIKKLENTGLASDYVKAGEKKYELEELLKETSKKLDQEIRDLTLQNKFNPDATDTVIQVEKKSTTKPEKQEQNSGLSLDNMDNYSNFRNNQDYHPYANTAESTENNTTPIKEQPKIAETTKESLETETLGIRYRLEKYRTYLEAKGLSETGKGKELYVLMGQMLDALDSDMELYKNDNFKKLFVQVEEAISIIPNNPQSLEKGDFSIIREKYNQILLESQKAREGLKNKVQLEKGFIEKNKYLYSEEVLKQLGLNSEENLDFGDYDWDDKIYSLLNPNLNNARDELVKIKENNYTIEQLLKKGEEMPFELNMHSIDGKFIDYLFGLDGKYIFTKFDNLIEQSGDPDVEAYLKYYYDNFKEDLKEAENTFQELKNRLKEIKKIYNQVNDKQREELDEEIKEIVSYMTLINGLDSDNILAAAFEIVKGIFSFSGAGMAYNLIEKKSVGFAMFLATSLVLSAALKPIIVGIKQLSFKRNFNRLFKGEEGIDKEKLKKIFDENLEKGQTHENIDSIIKKGKIDFKKLTIYEFKEILKEVKGNDSPEVNNINRLIKLIENKKALGDDFMAKKLEGLKMKVLNGEKFFSREVLMELFNLKSIKKTIILKYFEGDIIQNIRNLRGSRVTGGIFAGNNILFSDADNAVEQLDKILDFEGKIVKEIDKLKGLKGISDFGINNEKIPKIEKELEKLKSMLTNKYGFVANEIIDSIDADAFKDEVDKKTLVDKIKKELYNKEGFKKGDSLKSPIKKGLGGEKSILKLINKELKEGHKITKENLKIEQYESNFKNLSEEIRQKGGLRSVIIKELNKKLGLTIPEDIIDNKLKIGKSNLETIEKLKINIDDLKAEIDAAGRKLDSSIYKDFNKIIEADISPQNLETIKTSLENIVDIEKQIKNLPDDIQNTIRGVLQEAYSNIKDNANLSRKIELDTRLGELLGDDGEIKKIENILEKIDLRDNFKSEFLNDIKDKIKQGITEKKDTKITNINNNIEKATLLFDDVSRKDADNIIKKQVIKGIKEKIIFSTNEFEKFSKLVNVMLELEVKVNSNKYDIEKDRFEKAVKNNDLKGLELISEEIKEKIELEKIKIQAEIENLKNGNNSGNGNNPGNGNNFGNNSNNNFNELNERVKNLELENAKMQGIIEGLEKAGAFKKESINIDIDIDIDNTNTAQAAAQANSEVNINSKNGNGEKGEGETKKTKEYTDVTPKTDQIEDKPIIVEGEESKKLGLEDIKQIELEKSNVDKINDLYNRAIMQLELEGKFDEADKLGDDWFNISSEELAELDGEKLENNFKELYNFKELGNLEELDVKYQGLLNKINQSLKSLNFGFNNISSLIDGYKKIKDEKIKSSYVDFIKKGKI